MRYLIQKFLIVSLFSTYLVAYHAMAEPEAGFSSSNLNGMLTLGQVNQPTSANDFKSKVKSLGQKNRNELSQQFKQELTQQKQSTPQPQPATTGTPTTAPATTAATPSSTATPTTTAPQPPGTPEMQTPANAETFSPTFSSSAPGASPPPESTNMGTQAAHPPTGQGQVYTGFGAGTGTSTTPSSGQSSGGWNIKY